jgi:hypothetical protein
MHGPRYLGSEHAVKPRDHKSAAHEGGRQQINDARDNPPAVVERTPERVLADLCGRRDSQSRGRSAEYNIKIRIRIQKLEYSLKIKLELR